MKKNTFWLCLFRRGLLLKFVSVVNGDFLRVTKTEIFSKVDVKHGAQWRQNYKDSLTKIHILRTVGVWKCHLTKIGIPMIKIRWSHYHLIFIMKIVIRGKTVFFLLLGWGCGGLYASRHWVFIDPGDGLLPIQWLYIVMTCCMTLWLWFPVLLSIIRAMYRLYRHQNNQIIKTFSFKYYIIL